MIEICGVAVFADGQHNEFARLIFAMVASVVA